MPISKQTSEATNKKQKNQQSKFSALMSNDWKDPLDKIDERVQGIRTVSKIANKLELAHKKYGSNVKLEKRMTLTNFDDIIDSEWDKNSGSRKSQLNVIPESAGEQ